MISAHPVQSNAERPRVSNLRAGTVLQSRFVVERTIAVTTYSIVYAGRDQCSGAMVAIKRLIPPPHADTWLVKALRRAYLREAVLLRRLHHSRVPCLLAAFEDLSGLYLVMEHISGETLEQRLERGTMPRALALAIAYELCRALSDLHRHTPPIVHADLKPSNIMLANDGRVMLIDLGLARPRVARGWAIEPSGTPKYTPPEQWQGRPIDERADIHALGHVLRELFGDEASRSPLREVLDQATALAPDARFPTVRALYAALCDATESACGLCCMTAYRLRLAHSIWTVISPAFPIC
jgi:serine/threonine protein kinase